MNLISLVVFFAKCAKTSGSGYDADGVVLVEVEEVVGARCKTPPNRPTVLVNWVLAEDAFLGDFDAEHGLKTTVECVTLVRVEEGSYQVVLLIDFILSILTGFDHPYPFEHTKEAVAGRFVRAVVVRGAIELRKRRSETDQLKLDSPFQSMVNPIG